MPTRPSAAHPDEAGDLGNTEADPAGFDADEVFDDPGDEIAPTVGAGVPAVVAVIVTADATGRFEESLAGLAAQEYANLTVVVLDVGCAEDPTARIAEILPTAFVRPVQAATFGAACNDVLGTVEGATFLLFCHEDTCLAPDAIQALVTEAFRSNGGVVGAKLVDWDQPDRLRSVGYAVDKFGSMAPLVEPGELDQSQHDVVREVFMVPSAAMLVRADLFADLGGFALDLSGAGADLDLCWRAWVAGAHVVIMPAAVARHAADSPLADQPERDQRLAPRQEGRVMLTGYGPMHLIRVVPQALVLSLFDLIGSLVTGHARRAADIVSAWGWNLAHLPATVSMRRRVRRSRRATDSEVRHQQVRGSVRLSRALRDVRAVGGRRIPEAFAVARDLPNTWQEGTVLPGIGLILILGAAFLIGSRQLFSGGLPSLRQFAPIADPMALAREWWTGWRSSGVGHAGPSPTLFPVMGLAHLVMLGHTGTLRTLALLAGLPAGAVGAWRLLRGVAGVRARIAVAVAYVAVPVPYDAIAEGRWPVLAAYAVMPFVVGRLVRVAGVAPFDDHPPSVGWRPAAADGLAVGFMLAIGALISPAVIPIGLGVALVLALGLVVVGQRGAARRTAVCGVASALVAALLILPTTLDLLGRPDRWFALWGTASPNRSRLSDLARLSTGATAGGIVWYAMPVVAVLVLLVGRRERLRWGAVAWGLVVSSWAAVILAARWWPNSPRPATGMLLAPAAIAVALAVGLGVASFESDVVGRAFGWRQAVSTGAAVIAAAGVIPVLAVTVQGRWNLPQGDAVSAMPGANPSFRTLWIGAPDVLPLTAAPVSSGLAAATTTGVTPSLSDTQPARSGQGDRDLVQVLRTALDGGSARLGRRLAPFGIQYVVVVTSLSAASPVDEPASVSRAQLVLGQQLDLHSLEIAPGLDVYQSSAWVPLRASAAKGSFGPLTARPGTAPPVKATAVLGRGDPPASYTGPVADDHDVRVASQSASGWSLTVGGRTVAARSADWAQLYPVKAGGAATLSYDSPVSHTLLLVVQLLLIVALAGAAVRRRRARA
jgi:GT2 family glycosyltransferase